MKKCWPVSGIWRVCVFVRKEARHELVVALLTSDVRYFFLFGAGGLNTLSCRRRRRRHARSPRNRGPMSMNCCVFFLCFCGDKQA